MKIGMIGHKYVPSREGGVEIVVDNLATRMSKLGHDITLFNRKRKEYKKIDEYEGCKTVSVFTINKKSLDAIIYSFFATLKAKKIAKKGQLDVIHFHAEGPCCFLNLLKKRNKRNYKVIVTIHGLDWQRGKWSGLATKVLLHGEKQAVKYADEIIVLSKNNKQYFETKYNREVIYIPNGIEKAILHKPNIIKKKYNITENSYILFLARIVPEKGLHYLIDAWQSMKKEISTSMKLVIAGGDSHSSNYFGEMMDRVKNDSSIITTGFVEGQELQELYSNAYLYVLPSDIEGMPMSLLEALSYGNSCLVSDIPENTEIINENCFIFKKGNIDCLKEQLKKIISLDVKSHNNPIIQFTWTMVVDETLKVYRRK